MKPAELTELAHVSPYHYPVGCFLRLYELTQDESPAITDEEYDSARWYSVKDLISILSLNSAPHKGDLLPAVRLCYGGLKDTDRSVFRP